MVNQSLKWQNALLLVASYVFYGWWSWKFLLLLMLSTSLDFFYGFSVASVDKRKARLYLLLSVINNLGILAVFKYYNFFIAETHQFLEMMGLNASPLVLEIALPVGISFYTFHGMSYVFDIYRGIQKPVRNVVDYAVFVGFFPLLVAGPIERANHLLPQIQKSRIFNISQANEGVKLILWGLFKKVVIADSLAVIVNSIFENYQDHNAFALIIGAIGFSFQIYGDFSGYSDIAIGTAKLFGFELLSNFKFPYFSRNIIEFWKRWHISLTSWFRDYLYLPLGGSKKGNGTTLRNIVLVFLLSGLWHGANMKFIFWGLLHASAYLLFRWFQKGSKTPDHIIGYHSKLPSIKELFQVLITFSFVTFAWIFFRAPNLEVASNYCKKIFNGLIFHPAQFLEIPVGLSIFEFIIVFVLMDWWFRKDSRSLRTSSVKYLNYAIYIVMASMVLTHLNFFVNHKEVEFIYFQF